MLVSLDAESVAREQCGFTFSPSGSRAIPSDRLEWGWLGGVQGRPRREGRRPSAGGSPRPWGPDLQILCPPDQPRISEQDGWQEGLLSSAPRRPVLLGAQLSDAPTWHSRPTPAPTRPFAQLTLGHPRCLELELPSGSPGPPLDVVHT